MKLKMISLLTIIAAGVIALVITISAQTSVTKEYNGYLSKARANAEKEIPYVAVQNYKKAFAVRCEDEAIYKEYIAQAEKLGADYYNSAIKDYIVKFPESAEGYELYCKMLYDRKSYSLLLDAALEAREKGIATEQVRLLYTECSHMLKSVSGGFNEAQSFFGGYARVKVGELYGYITQSGSFLIAPTYTGATLMMGTNAAANNGTEWSMINTLGFTVARVSKPVDDMSVMVGGKIAVGVNGKYGYMNGSLVVPETLPYDYATCFKNGVAAIKKGEKWGLINIEEQPITECIFEDILLDEFGTCINNGVVFAKKDGKYYMLNANGEKITDQAFDEAYPFVGKDPAAICIGGKWGFVDNVGNVVIKPQYDGAKSFNLALGAVCINDQWGYINRQGEIRIEPQFEDCLPFAANGIAAVKINDYWQYKQLLPYYY